MVNSQVLTIIRIMDRLIQTIVCTNNLMYIILYIIELLYYDVVYNVQYVLTHYSTQRLQLYIERFVFDQCLFDVDNLSIDHFRYLKYPISILSDSTLSISIIIFIVRYVTYLTFVRKITPKLTSLKSSDNGQLKSSFLFYLYQKISSRKYFVLSLLLHIFMLQIEYISKLINNNNKKIQKNLKSSFTFSIF